MTDSSIARDENPDPNRDPADTGYWRATPKIELHLHLEGAAPPGLIRDMARARRIDIARIFAPDGSYAWTDFAHFLQVYEAATSVLKTPDDYARLTRAVLQSSAENGVIYTEVFLSPDFCGGRDIIAWADHLAAITEAAATAERDFGIVSRGIVTCIRHFGPAAARQTARCAAETAGDFITGFGMAGDESVLTPGDFVWSFDCAREAGLRLTSHAAEWQGPDEVNATLDALRVDRIGHGVRGHTDLALLDRLAETRVMLEVCPISNVTLGIFPDMAAHPIAKLRERGVRVSINTDDPPYWRTTMTQEFAALEQAFGWGRDTFAAITRDSLDAAFCDASTRDRLAKRLD